MTPWSQNVRRWKNRTTLYPRNYTSEENEYYDNLYYRWKKMGIKEEEEKRRFIEEEFRRRAAAHERFRDMMVYNKSPQQKETEKPEPLVETTTDATLQFEEEDLKDEEFFDETE